MKPIISILLTFFAYTSISAQHWNTTELSPMPVSVSNNAVCEGFVNGIPYVYSFAGIDSTKIFSGIHNDAYRYNTQTDTWENLPPLPDDMGKIAASANRVGDIIYIIGGYHVFSNGTEQSSEKVHRFDTQTNSYLSDGTNIPISIDDQVQTVYKDSLIYVISGWHDTGNINEVQIYDPANDQWHAGSPITWMEEPVFGGSGVILGDTIYFYGGARNGNFAISRRLRKGVINPNNPLEIEWSSEVLSFSLQAYRSAATTAGNNVYFLGGSDETYNFDGLAYSNGQGVDPNNRSLLYNSENAFFEGNTDVTLPMDLRGIANANDTVKYLAGGMLEGQQVTNKLWRLNWQGTITSNSEPLINSLDIKIFPNPASDFIEVKLPEHISCSQTKVAIYDILGKLIIEKETACEPIDIQSLPPGVFQVNVSKGTDSGSSKIFLKRKISR